MARTVVQRQRSCRVGRLTAGLRLPDAIVLDTALSRDARALATFDARLAVAGADPRIEVLGAGRSFD